MCNLYSITTNQAAIIALFRVVNRYVGNLAPMPGVFPDYKAPIVRNGAEGRELATARWGMPSSSARPDGGDEEARRKAGGQGQARRFQGIAPDGARQRHDQHPQREEQALDSLARRREPLRGAVQLLQRVQQGRGRRHLVCARRDPSPRLFRRHLDQLDVRPEGEGRRDHQRHLRVPDDGAERRGRRHPPEGDAGDPDDAGRSRDLDDGASGRGS